MRMHAEIRCPCAFAFLGDLELLLLLIPCGQLVGRDGAVEHLALTDVCIRRTAFQAAAVLPKPLPPEVANRKIFLPEKSLLSRNVLMIVGATYHQMGNARKMVS